MTKSKPKEKGAQEKEQIFLRRVCPFCPARVNRSYSSFQKVREHVVSCKKIILRARNANQRKDAAHKYYSENQKENAEKILLCCPSCEETFDSKSDLKSHVLKVHVEIGQSSEPDENTWNIDGIDIN